MRTVLSGIGAIGCVALVLVAAVALFFGGLLLQRFVFDIQRENIQHSQQYVETKNQELLGLIRAYEDPNASDGQRRATVNQFCDEVNLLEPDTRVVPVRTFASAHC